MNIFKVTAQKKDHTVWFAAEVSLTMEAIISCLGIPVKERTAFAQILEQDYPVMQEAIGIQEGSGIKERIASLRRLGNEILKVKGIFRFVPIDEWRKALSDCCHQDQEAFLTQSGCEHVIPVLLTLGQTFEQGKQNFDVHDILSQWIWEAIGNGALFAAAKEFVLWQESRGTDLQATMPLICRQAPGDGSWPLEMQKVIFDFLQPQDLGVVLSKKYTIEPAKSLTQVLGLVKQTTGKGLNQATVKEHCCQDCDRSHCLFRR